MGWHNNHLEHMIVNCDTCAKFQSQQKKEPLQSTELPERPWEKVAVDLFELQENVCLDLVDYYFRFPEVRKVPNIQSSGVVSARKQKVLFACHGIPYTVCAW